MRPSDEPDTARARADAQGHDGEVTRLRVTNLAVADAQFAAPVTHSAVDKNLPQVLIAQALLGRLHPSEYRCTVHLLQHLRVQIEHLGFWRRRATESDRRLG